jgi:hypothetical protein
VNRAARTFTPYSEYLQLPDSFPTAIRNMAMISAYVWNPRAANSADVRTRF